MDILHAKEIAVHGEESPRLKTDRQAEGFLRKGFPASFFAVQAGAV